ncbi:MAG: SDR family oxidoreductase [Elusimicrobiota bacterium]|jgi:dTDP-4-dehydrorhamnose reductase
MKVLIVGSTGLVGHALYRHLSSQPGFSVLGTSRADDLPGLERLDVLEKGAFSGILEKTKPEVVLFPAAQPHVDACEQSPAETRRLNVEATLDAARSTLSSGARFVFFSTDYVFDGKTSGAYHEEDVPCPINEYGRQKLDVEQALGGMDGSWLVLRVSAVFGWELNPRNFTLKVLSVLREGGQLRCAQDQVYNPTYAPSLAQAADRLISSGAEGIFHLAGPQTVSRYEFARKAAEAFSLDGKRILGGRLSELLGPGIAPRPLRTPLDSSRARRLLGEGLMDVDEALSHMRANEREWTAHSVSFKESRR